MTPKMHTENSNCVPKNAVQNQPWRGETSYANGSAVADDMWCHPLLTPLLRLRQSQQPLPSCLAPADGNVIADDIRSHVKQIAPMPTSLSPFSHSLMAELKLANQGDIRCWRTSRNCSNDANHCLPVSHARMAALKLVT